MAFDIVSHGMLFYLRHSGISGITLDMSTLKLGASLRAWVDSHASLLKNSSVDIATWAAAQAFKAAQPPVLSSKPQHPPAIFSTLAQIRR